MDGEFMSQVNYAMRDGTVNNKKIYDRELTHRENDMHALQRIQPELDRLARFTTKTIDKLEEAMKGHKFSPLKIALLLCLLALLFAGERFTSVHANVLLQNSCEAACVCDGYTVDKLQYEDEHRILSETFKPINSKCVYEYFFWLQRNGGGGNVSDKRAVYQNFLDEWQKWCDDCRGKLPGSAPTDTPTPTPVPELEEPSNGDAGDNGGIEESTPCDPYTKMGDLDCDGIPDNDDLCLYTPGTEDRCGCDILIAGDFLFREGAASYVTNSIALDDGKYEADFGHVGIYAGDFELNDGYPIFHPNGIQTLVFKDDRYVRRNSRPQRVEAGTILIEAVIEADKTVYGGVALSDFLNFASDHKKFADYGNYTSFASGRPSYYLSCSDRKEIVNSMLYRAKLRDTGGSTGYDFFDDNCANEALWAYLSVDVNKDMVEIQNHWVQWAGWPLSPNYLASFLTLHNAWTGERLYTPGRKPIISIGTRSSLGRRFDFAPDTQMGVNALVTNKSEIRNVNDSGPIFLHVHDGTGNHTGSMQTGFETGIPGSEIWPRHGEFNFINIYNHTGERLTISVDGNDITLFQLSVVGMNYPSPGDITQILYPEVQYDPNALMQIELQPSALDPQSLGLYIYRNGADYSEEVILPTVEIRKIQYDVQVDELENYSPLIEAPLSITSNWILWGAIPSVLCFGASFIVLIAGVFTKNKKISTLGIVLIAVVICVVMIAAAFYAGSQLLAPEPANSLDNAPMLPPPQQEIPFPDAQPTVFVPADIPPTLAPVVPTIVPTEEPHSQEAYPEPTVYNFATCPSPCLGDLSNRQSTFPEKTERLYLRFNYDWIPPGSDYVRLWKNGGQEWVRYQCKWDGPESGVFETDLREPAGFRSGEWTMEIYVNGQLVAQNSFIVQGNYTYWDPAGTINRCK